MGAVSKLVASPAPGDHMRIFSKPQTLNPRVRCMSQRQCRPSSQCNHCLDPTKVLGSLNTGLRVGDAGFIKLPI